MTEPMIPWTSPNPLVGFPYPLYARPGCIDGDSLQSQIHEDEYGLRAVVRPGDVVIDCGAYIGAVSALAASLGAVVSAVEPSAQNCGLWRANTRTWRGQCYLWQGALSDAKIAVSLRQRVNNGNYSQMHRFVGWTSPHFKIEESEVVETVPAIDLNEVLDITPGPIRMLKMDIEGAEFEVLPTMRPDNLRRIDHIALEVHRSGIPIPEAFSMIHQMLPGFRVVRTNLLDMFLEREGLAGG